MPKQLFQSGVLPHFLQENTQIMWGGVKNPNIYFLNWFEFHFILRKLEGNIFHYRFDCIYLIA
jgi:hypothetical protein